MRAVGASPTARREDKLPLWTLWTLALQGGTAPAHACIAAGWRTSRFTTLVVRRGPNARARRPSRVLHPPPPPAPPPVATTAVQPTTQRFALLLFPPVSPQRLPRATRAFRRAAAPAGRALWLEEDTPPRRAAGPHFRPRDAMGCGHGSPSCPPKKAAFVALRPRVGAAARSAAAPRDKKRRARPASVGVGPGAAAAAGAATGDGPHRPAGRGAWRAPRRWCR